MSVSARVPTKSSDIRSPHNSLDPKVSMIFGHVRVARQRSSNPAGGRRRASS
jgi:hypothetical protein